MRAHALHCMLNAGASMARDEGSSESSSLLTESQSENTTNVYDVMMM